MTIYYMAFGEILPCGIQQVVPERARWLHLARSGILYFTVTQQKNKSKTIQCIKLRNWDVIEDKEIRHLSKF